ncbi:MAG: CCA tRNA nucleotidyltransferase [Pseudomonadota bacterium]
MAEIPKLRGAWLEDPALQGICRMLEDNGHQAFLVGGCVRNALMEMPVTEVDIATEAPPDRVMELAVSHGLKAVPTGLDHGTVTLVNDAQAFEVTTFRRDVDTDGRHAVVAFGRDIAEDAGRRDFTVNALYSIRNGTVSDPLGGFPDIAARRIRFIGDAHLRIREDYLRILRFFRFHAWYGRAGDDPDAEGLSACAELADGIDRLSRERVGAEMLKLLAAPDPAPVLATMQGAGILRHALTGAGSARIAPLVTAEAALGLAPDPLRRLAALGADAPEQHLRLSRKQARALDTLCADPAGGAAELGHRHGAQTALDLLALRAARSAAPPATDWRAEAARGAAARFPLQASDLMPDYEGAALGARLRTLEARWIASDFRLTRADLLAPDTP